jgi:hypothetical protein
VWAQRTFFSDSRDQEPRELVGNPIIKRELPQYPHNHSI